MKLRILCPECKKENIIVVNEFILSRAAYRLKNGDYERYIQSCEIIWDAKNCRCGIITVTDPEKERAENDA